jgi:ATP-dependent RNA helicase DeaD
MTTVDPPPLETAVPDSIAEPGNPLPTTALDALPLAMREAAARAGWNGLMPVQAYAIPYLRDGRDLMVQSRTGSGKTGAYVLPMLERLDVRRAETQALVLVPTRELARQVASEAMLLTGEAGLRTAAVYGGVGYGPQLEALRQGAHIVVGTPGRVLDHLLRRALRLDALRILVLDEADRMLSMGFYPDMRRVQGYLPEREISTYLFSATFPTHVISLASRFLRQQDLLSLSRDHVHVTDIDHVCYETAAMDKDRALLRIIEVENPPEALIFCNTRQRTHYVSVVLKRFGYDADELSSDLSQAERQAVLDRLRRGQLRFLVATDVAARGLDIPTLSYVILYEIPEDHDDYIHRSGRTGRAGAAGTAISVVSGLEAMALRRIARLYGIALEERTLPTDEQVQAVVAERATVLLEAAARDRDRMLVERALRFAPLAQTLARDEDGIALLAMLLDDLYHGAVHGRALTDSGDVVPSRDAERRPAPERRRRRRTPAP